MRQIEQEMDVGSGYPPGTMAPSAKLAPSPRRESGTSRDSKICDAIMAAARQLIGSVGYHRITVDDIRRHARVSRTTFFFYFRDKKHVFGAVIEHSMQE